ncbi:MAG TPA: hypothetical protein VGM64_07645 [Lacunisphaera sp.]|jgi:uncharacterized membrane protein YdjX (TVP38/TMEM64 family)
MPVSSETITPGAIRQWGASGPVAIVLSFWPPLGGFVLLAFLTALGPWLRTHGSAGMAIYFLVAGILLGVSFVPTYSCAILAGWAFGFCAGFSLAAVTITASSLMAYAIERWIARDRVLEVMRTKPKWNAIHRALLGGDKLKTIFVVTLLRIPPTSPFAFANFVLAAFAAAKLEQLRFKDVSQTWMVIAGIVATIVVCVVLGVLANRALRQITVDQRVL